MCVHFGQLLKERKTRRTMNSNSVWRFSKGNMLQYDNFQRASGWNMNLERYLALTPFADSLKHRESVELQISQINSCFVRRVQVVRHNNVSPQFCLEPTRNTASKLVQIMIVFARWFAIWDTFDMFYSVRQSFQIQLSYARINLSMCESQWKLPSVWACSRFESAWLQWFRMVYFTS